MPKSGVRRWFIVVRRRKPVLYKHLREQYEGDGRVEVIVDRRRAPIVKIPADLDMRRAERRIGDRRAGQSDRRQAARRRPLEPFQHAFWVTEGFFMVRRSPNVATP